MSRPPESKHPLLPWAILFTVAVIAFHVGMSVAAFFLALLAGLLRWPSGIGYFSLKRIDALIANPMTLTIILAAGIAATIWAVMIARKTLKERQHLKE